jgi:hypothetical protein
MLAQKNVAFAHCGKVCQRLVLIACLRTSEMAEEHMKLHVLFGEH